jgi:hypothetical protein
VLPFEVHGLLPAAHRPVPAGRPTFPRPVIGSERSRPPLWRPRRAPAHDSWPAAPLKGDLDWIALKAINRDRTRRYETANALALDVERYLENKPIVRPPLTWAIPPRNSSAGTGSAYR